jgi:hypothetical protein
LKVRTAVVSGIYPQARDNGELLRGILARMARVTQGFTVLGMSPVDVTEAQDVTMIPGHQAVRPALYIQQHGGLYNHGCACFLLDGTMWVYPPYDIQRYSKRLADKTERVLEIYQVDPLYYLERLVTSAPFQINRYSCSTAVTRISSALS